MLHKVHQVEEYLGMPVTISNICMSESYLRVGSSIKETSPERKASQAPEQGFFFSDYVALRDESESTAVPFKLFVQADLSIVRYDGNAVVGLRRL